MAKQLARPALPCAGHDSLDCIVNWAKETHQKHRSDKREYTYTWCGAACLRTACAGLPCENRPAPPVSAQQQALVPHKPSAQRFWVPCRAVKWNSHCAVKVRHTGAGWPRPSAPPRRDQFEKAETHDELWNAAQKQMTQHGKMHGFMRMVRARCSPGPRICQPGCTQLFCQLHSRARQGASGARRQPALALGWSCMRPHMVSPCAAAVLGKEGAGVDRVPRAGLRLCHAAQRQVGDRRQVRRAELRLPQPDRVVPQFDAATHF